MNLPITLKNGTFEHGKIYNYPDGQKNIVLDMKYFNDPKSLININCNVRNFSELELLLCIVAALRKNDFTIESINFVYLFGMRSDRSFETGMPNYFRDVIAPIINNLEIPNITFLHPHSLISLSAIKNSNVYSNSGYNILFSQDMYFSIKIGADESVNNFLGNDICGSFVKIRELGNVKCVLNKETKLYISRRIDSPLIIVDDLCDGGTTFIEESKILRQEFPDRKLYLYILHGLFTKGIDHVADHFDKIFVTNSYQDFEQNPKLQVIEVI